MDQGGRSITSSLTGYLLISAPRWLPGIAVGMVYRLRQALGMAGKGDRVKVVEPFHMLLEMKENLLINFMQIASGFQAA